MIEIRSYPSASDFLNAAGPLLYRHEAANGLMLGVCGQILRNPERFAGRICYRTVEEGGALRLAAIMTPPHRLQLSCSESTTEGRAAALADSLQRDGWDIPGVMGPAGEAKAVVERLAALAGRGYRLENRLRLYELRSVAQPPPARGRLRTALPADRPFLTRWWYDAQMEMFGKAERAEAERTALFRLGDGAVSLWEDGRPVSMAVRTRPTENGISVGMVYTPPNFRRRGYATACVTELSRLLLNEGRQFCSLYADLANPVSNSIYRRIGYRPVCDFEEYGFLESAKSPEETTEEREG
jgi:predicted GNAT family acetyltransferase